MSFTIIRDIISNQHPSVIVLDVYYMVYNRYSNSQSRIHEVTDSMGILNPNRYEAINDLVPKVQGDEDVWSFYFNLAYYHTRWEELTTGDFVKTNQFLKGADPRNGTKNVKIYKASSESVSIPEIPMEYLKKIIQLCKQTNTELQLITIPYTMAKSKKATMQEQLAIFNAMEEYTKEEGIHYINLFNHMEEMGMGTNEDFYNTGHLSISGATKLSKYIGSYLKSHYDLPDHRDDPKYSTAWNADYLLTSEMLEKMKEEQHNSESE